VPFDEAYPKYPGALEIIAAGNLTGWPAIGFPNGFGPSGLPTGASLFCKPFTEAVLEATVRKYQSHTDFHLRRPLPQPFQSEKRDGLR
jgi:Asp-tRNA(Asn)/Glu-tRNA(Gln) amidotransferase A subunit family amidase